MPFPKPPSLRFIPTMSESQKRCPKALKGSTIIINQSMLVMGHNNMGGKTKYNCENDVKWGRKMR